MALVDYQRPDGGWILWIRRDPVARELTIAALIGHLGWGLCLFFGLITRWLFGVPGIFAMSLYAIMFLLGGGYTIYSYCQGISARLRDQLGEDRVTH